MSPVLPTWLNGLVTLAWLVVDLGVAAAAWCRFRATASGRLLGGSCLLRALGGLPAALVDARLLADAAWSGPGRRTAALGHSAPSLCCELAIAIGIAPIPESPRRLGG